jgi:hypothetical protein
VDAADADRAVHQAGDVVTDAKIIFPPEFKTGDWMPAKP